GLRREHARQGGAAAFATRKGLWVLGASEAERVQQILGAIIVVAPCHARLDIVERRRKARQIGLLRQIADGGAGLDEAHASVMLDEACGDLEQGRLARAIAPDKGNALARRDDE